MRDARCGTKATTVVIVIVIVVSDTAAAAAARAVVSMRICLISFYKIGRL